MQAKQSFFFFHSKINRVHFSAVSVCSNPCVEPIPKTNMSFMLLSMCAEKIISTPKINTFDQMRHLEMKNLFFYQI